MEIRYTFLDRTSDYSPVRHIFPPTYTLCPSEQVDECEGLNCSTCNGFLCLNADIEIEHKNNINYKYWVNYALKQTGMLSHMRQTQGPIQVDMDTVKLILSLFDAEDSSLRHSWEIPLVGDELIFVTAVPPSGFWRIAFTFVFEDTLGNRYIGSARDDFTQSAGDTWECQDYVFPDAYITFAGYNAPTDVDTVCPGENCTLVVYEP